MVATLNKRGKWGQQTLFREGHYEFEHGEFEQPIRYPDVDMQRAAGYVKL